MKYSHERSDVNSSCKLCVSLPPHGHENLFLLSDFFQLTDAIGIQNNNSLVRVMVIP